MASSHSTDDDEKQEATVDIAKDGDIVFIVGPNRKRLRVHSLLLTNASPVFKAMLGPSFKEGQQLAQAGFAEVELPEDDPNHAEIIFNVIHGQNEEVPESLQTEQLFQVATMADKYDCIMSLAFAFESWLQDIGTLNSAESSWTVAMIALAASRSKPFTEATSTLLLNHSGSYLDLTKNGPLFLDMTMQLRMAAMLELARGKLYLILFRELSRVCWAEHLPMDCQDLQTAFVQRTRALEDEPMSLIIQQLDQDSLPKSSARKRLGLPLRTTIRTTEELNDMCKQISQRCRSSAKEEGLCLQCVKTGASHEKHRSTPNYTGWGAPALRQVQRQQ